MLETENGNKRKGFASMTPERLREVASKGGKQAKKSSAHRWTSEKAKEAGRKGGLAVSKDREHMAAIGSRGGKNRHKKESV